MALQSRKMIPINFGGQFATLWANVAIIKYCCFDEIHNVMKVNPKPNSISLASSSFHKHQRHIPIPPKLSATI
jgi:hypothetical protein